MGNPHQEIGYADTDEISAAVEALLDRDGGLTVADLAVALGIGESSAGRRVERRVKAGQWFGGLHLFSRVKHYFSSTERRDAWLLAGARVPTSALELMAWRMLHDGRPWLTPADLAVAAGVRTGRAGTAAMRMVDRGIAVRVGSGNRTFYFVDAAAAGRFDGNRLSRLVGQLSCRPAAARVPLDSNAKQNISIGKQDAEKRGHGKRKLFGEAQGLDTTPVQRPEDVWVGAKWRALELQADPRWPSFASSPIGSNPLTGKAW